MRNAWLLLACFVLACSADLGADGGGDDRGGERARTDGSGDPSNPSQPGAGGGGEPSSPDGGAGTGSGGSVYVPPPTCVDESKLPSWRQGMAIGEWKQLASADIAQVTPSVEPGGYYSARIDAWNGFAADVTNNIVYLGGVGGHGDYAGNEVYALDLDAASPQWVLQMQPSPSSAYLVDQPYYSDGKPSATHTYYTTWFIEQRGKFFRFAGAATWGSGNGSTRYIDSWNPQTKAWDPKDTNPQLGTAPIYEMPTAKDYVTGDVYQLQGNNRLYRWNQATNTVTDLGNAGGGGGSFYELEASPSVVDTKNGRLLFLSDTANPGKIRVYDLAAKTWSTVTPTGAAASSITKAHSQGMAYYDYCSDKIVVTTGQGGTIYLLDPVTFAATTMPTSGSAPPNPVNGAHTLFQMLPKLGGYAYQPRHSSKMYFLATQ